MNVITDESIVDLILQLNWQSPEAHHSEMYMATGFNIWRDTVPSVLSDGIRGKRAGDLVRVEFKPGTIISKPDASRMHRIANKQVDWKLLGTDGITPRNGRFYPRGMLRGVAGVFTGNMEPFRCVDARNGHFDADLNHPLAGKEISLTATIGRVDTKAYERGGASIDWLDTLNRGPGMQARREGERTDYLSDDPFAREDESVDTLFYQRPRFVDHLDGNALNMVEVIYARLLENGMEILDLMGSWTSHLPSNLQPKRLCGLGLNQEEMAQNPMMDQHLVRDLNHNPHLPYAAGSFDAVVCTVSVEYLTRPLEVFKEVARVLRPGGKFVVTFSNRWFPSKVIRVWKELHEFERQGLVLDYFLESGLFKGLQTYSVRGLPRPHDDKYFPHQR